ncbi:MAG: TonB-dependent receptor, partial [Peristeroidobacter soli]
YKLTPDSNIYASFTEGYKSGIIPILQDPPTAVSPEKVDAYEVGYKLAAPAFSFDGAAFYYKYKDLQVQTYHGVLSVTENAARSTIYGLDLALNGKLGTHFTVRAGVAYTHAKYDSFPGAQDYVQDTTPTSPTYGLFLNPEVNASGNQMLRSPDWTETLGLTYGTPVAGGELTLNGDFYATSKIYFDAPNRFSQDAYQLLNVRMKWTAPSTHWSVGVYGTNVTNTKYRLGVLPGPFAIQQVYGEPAAFGVNAELHF